MEIVIKIPENTYEATCNGCMLPPHVENVVEAIKNGKPLPKGHGRLIDADELKSMSYEVLVDTDNPNRADGLSACNGLVEEDIDLAPTIIKGSDADEVSD